MSRIVSFKSNHASSGAFRFSVSGVPREARIIPSTDPALALPRLLILFHHPPQADIRDPPHPQPAFQENGIHEPG